MTTGKSPTWIRCLNENSVPIGGNKEARSLMEIPAKVLAVDDYSVFGILLCDCILLHDIVVQNRVHWSIKKQY